MLIQTLSISLSHPPLLHSSSFTKPLIKLPFFTSKIHQKAHHTTTNRKLTVFAVKEDDDPQPTPSWAKPGSEEPPPWARNEAQQASSGFELPFFVYLLASAITAIAAIGSVFEYVNQKPVFGLLNSDSIFYAPVLGFFAFTGVPTAAYLWFKSVQVANKEAEEQDRRDGYR
ncbi:hypothetical protein M8C21_006091 [Ambrosia artemisiifolia]|uniref:Transmembrane protein n=1 Tax=Ambrosia artemisiifolia TaxID=4212 RepID=A0AAD5BRN4_AMBAR|nr:hypothetical protein M8C21_006091 [Ambrosia artemisiifolia]